MSLIRCTAKILKEIRLKGADLVNDGIPYVGLGDWYANLLIIERRKCVLFTSEKTLYSFLVPGVLKKDFKTFENLFRINLRLNLVGEGFRENIVERIMAEYMSLDMGKTRNRSVLGSMNELAYQYKVCIQIGGGINGCDIIEINKKVNRTLMGAIDNRYGIDSLRYMFGDRRLMDQDLQRIEYRRGILERGMSPEDLPTNVWEGDKIPREVRRAIKDEDILNIAGSYGDRYATVDSIEYDYLKIVLDSDVVEVEFYNRGYTLFRTNDEKVLRTHRVLCTLMDRVPDRTIGAAMVSGQIINTEKTGRNAPCPCGSGKKYKKCCMN